MRRQPTAAGPLPAREYPKTMDDMSINDLPAAAGATPPSAPAHRIGPLNARVARQWRRVADLRLQPFGMTEATWLPLLRISQAGVPLRQKELAALLALDNSSVVRLIDMLEHAGHLVRRESADDRRAKALELTPRGIALAAQLDTVACGLRDEALAGLAPDDIAAACRVLAHLDRFFDTAVGPGEAA